MPDKTTKTGALMSLSEPQFLTVTKSPSNKAGFKIIRSDDDGNVHRIRRRAKAVKRADDKLLTITFPEDITEEEALAIRSTYGLGDDYEVKTNENGSVYLSRRGDHPESTVNITMGNGYEAVIAADAFVKRSDGEERPGVTVTSLHFSTDWSVESVQRWLEDNQINYKADGVTSDESGVTVLRHDVPEDQETHSATLTGHDEGITVTITATRADDVPAAVYVGVAEWAYGNYGWGHLDFSQSMADIEFSDKSWDAVRMLREVMENIIIYSGLDLEERKRLVQNALADFGNYITGLIDSLPRGLVLETRSDRSNNNQENEMADNTAQDSEKDTVKENVQRAAAAAVGAGSSDTDSGTEAQTTQQASAQGAESDDTVQREDDAKEQYVTRSEMQTAITDAVTAGVTAALQATQGQQVNRSDDQQQEETPVTLESIAEQQKVIMQRMDELGDTTVAVRSDDDPPAESGDEPKGTFSGIFG